MTELLAPAGNMDAFHAALSGGADAVYMGGRQYGARAFADNFSEEELLHAIRIAHLHHKKLYLTVNTITREQELSGLPVFLRPFYEEGLDGVIVADVGVASLIRSVFPDMPIHASTQMTLTGPICFDHLLELGITRVVPARELSIKELRSLCEEAGKNGMELEVFIHGAMCYAYSGQCLMSSMMGQRSGNRGRCGGACRLPVDVYSGQRQLNQDQLKFQLSMKDLCLLPRIYELMDLGISSFKIEGRMKSPEYVYFVTSLYRKYMDRFLAGNRSPIEKNDLYELEMRFNRGGLAGGYLDRHNGREMIMLGRAGYTGSEALDVTIPQTQPVPVNGSLYVEPDKPLRFELEVARPDKHFSASVTGALAQEAKNRPTTAGDMEKQFCKLGGTGFVMQDFSCYFRMKGNPAKDDGFLKYDEADGTAFPNVFVPVGAMNELRRTAADLLLQNILESKKRSLDNETLSLIRSVAENKEVFGEGSIPARQIRGNETEAAGDEDGRTYIISVRSIEQLRAIGQSSYARLAAIWVSYDLVRVPGLSTSVNDILEAARQAGTKCFVQLPAVSRQSVTKEYADVLTAKTLAYFDGIVCGNIESLAWIEKAKEGPGEAAQLLGSMQIITDRSIPVLTARASSWLAGWGAQQHVASAEMTAFELSDLLKSKAWKASGGQMILPVYGHIPVMVSAQCLRSTNKSCMMELGSSQQRRREAAEPLVLQDRIKKRFPVILHCDRCENTIYNTVPLSLHRDMDKVQKLLSQGIRALQISFTVESGAQTQEILSFFLDSEAKGTVPRSLSDFTRGHFLKGVE
ncbi:MAG: U32 family peptidase [Lachnospiraceae bacterium]|nr:U32 family peptidase [Lachnospiraceae bacterium]